MQNKLALWRAENPIFFIACYFLIGFLSYTSTKQYWPKLGQSYTLCIFISSLLILYFYIQNKHAKNWFQILPTTILFLWGICIAHAQNGVSYLNLMVASDWINGARTYLLNKIDHSFLEPASNSFAKNFLFGTKSTMDQTLKTAYQQLGILHIIAISGMHLDILFKLLNSFTAWLPNLNWARWTKLIALLFVVWTYTCIANAGPSVVRASLFFSLLLIGRFFHLNLFSFNTISTGILLVLLYNSQILTAIGLQLSYSAVVGIHFFYKPIALLVDLDNKLLKIIWNNLALSMAAQLTTLPIILYYFHTSSSLSIIGNFLFIPISSLLLYALLVFMLLPNVGSIQSFMANGISLYIQKMQQSIEQLYHLLQVDGRRYELGLVGLTFYYFCLFVGFFWIQNKNPTGLPILLIGACAYSLIKLFSL